MRTVIMADQNRTIELCAKIPTRTSHARRTMRNNWILTPAETVIFIAGVALLAGGAMWARAKGVPLGRRKVKASVEARIRELGAEGMGILKIGRTMGVGTSVVQRVLITQA